MEVNNLADLDLSSYTVEELEQFQVQAELALMRKTHEVRIEAYRCVKEIADKAGMSLQELIEYGERTEGKLKNAAEPKYSDGQGNTWSGRGRMSVWLKTQINSGKKLEDFLINKGA